MDHLLKILHYVHDAWPVQVGYTIRTHYIASTLCALGYRVSVCNSLIHDIRSLAAKGLQVQRCTNKDGVQYFTVDPKIFDHNWTHAFLKSLSDRGVRGLTRLRRRLELPIYTDWLTSKIGKVDLVHSHSPPATGAEAARLAKRLRVPMVYEVRGFWRLGHAANKGERINVADSLAEDVRVANKADRVVAICQGIADQLVYGGIPSDRISIVPNGVDTSVFHPIDRNKELAARLGVEGKIIYGYATNVRRLEGIQAVIKTWPHIVKAIPEAVFVLIGDGSYLSTLKALARDYGLGDTFRFLGRVPHAEMRAYYSLLDVFVVPRIPEPVCEIVTPLKPLEAMAMGIPIIASNVSALCEMVQNEKTGILFKAGDPKALAEACLEIGENVGLRNRISAQARAWVKQERDWTVLTSLYRDVYDSCL